MNNDCLFCDKDNPEKNKVILENDLFYSRWCDYPVTKGHSEIVLKEHRQSFFDLTDKDLTQMYDLLKQTKQVIDKKYHPQAYNIGINEGEAAGRTIHHLHIHLIPRYKGDVENPRGGIRNIIPSKGDYPTK